MAWRRFPVRVRVDPRKGRASPMQGMGEISDLGAGRYGSLHLGAGWIRRRRKPHVGPLRGPGFDSQRLHVIDNNAIEELEELVRPYTENGDAYEARELVKVILKNYKLIKLAVEIDKYNKEV